MKNFNLISVFKPTNVMELLVMLTIGLLLSVLLLDRFLKIRHQRLAKINENRYQSFKANKMNAIQSLMIQETEISFESIQPVLGADMQRLSKKYRDILLHDIATLKRMNPEINVQNYTTLLRYVQNTRN